MNKEKNFVGFDCDDDGLNTAVAKGRRQSFLFGSDYPHEVFDAAKCRREIDECLERDELTQEDEAVPQQSATTPPQTERESHC